MTPDLRLAKVYVSILGDKEKKGHSLAQIEGQKPAIRSAVGQAVRLRLTPEIQFVLDETMDNAMKLEKIFKQIHEEEKKRTKKEDGQEGT